MCSTGTAGRNCPTCCTPTSPAYWCTPANGSPVTSGVRFNAEYPGFQGYELVDRVVSGDRAAARAHVTGLVAGRLRHFEVAEFLTAKNGLIADLVEVWADLDQAPPTRDNR